jgi:hypothetical protein
LRGPPARGGIVGKAMKQGWQGHNNALQRTAALASLRPAAAELDSFGHCAMRWLAVSAVHALVFVLATFGQAWAEPNGGERYSVDAKRTAAEYRNVTVVQVRDDHITGSTYSSDKIDASPDLVKDGQYTSSTGHFRIRVPRLSTSQISLHQCIRYRRPDGTPATVHVRFIEDGPSTAVVVATRIRDGLPKDESLLDRVEGGQREMLAELPANRYAVTRVHGSLGAALQIVVRNRVADRDYPYAPALAGSADKLSTIGVSRLIIRGDFLYEFGMVVPCDSALPAGVAIARALDQLDLFMGGFSAI